jgi:hypothetical protein
MEFGTKPFKLRISRAAKIFGIAQIDEPQRKVLELWSKALDGPPRSEKIWNYEQRNSCVWYALMVQVWQSR